MGTSVIKMVYLGRDEDHPHAYGDKRLKQLTLREKRGSSPRVWGQVEAIKSKQAEAGIIPTRMGTRWRCPVLRKVCRDHPHAYGDKDGKNIARADMPGSSPRVWGQVLTLLVSISTFGIIPTRMGTRSLFNQMCGGQGDHPHAYGDKLKESQKEKSSAGSSPRVWGQVCYRTISRHVSRIIPTRMGTRVAYQRRCFKNQDHPHAYGDKQ